MKNQKIVFCIILILTMIGVFAGDRNIPKKLSKDEKEMTLQHADSLILIGNKTSDSTGNISITSSKIASLISSIAPLNGFVADAQSRQLKITPITAYLLLKGTESGNSMHIAIQLHIIDDNLYFKEKGSLMLHVCKDKVSCTNCSFYVMGNMIIACKCEIYKNENNPSSECVNSSYWLR